MDHSLRTKLANVLFADDNDCNVEACEKLYKVLRTINYSHCLYYFFTPATEELLNMVKATGHPTHMFHRYRLIVWSSTSHVFVEPQNSYHELEYLLVEDYKSKHHETLANVIVSALHTRIGQKSSIFRAFGRHQHHLSELYLIPLILEFANPDPSCQLQDDTFRNELMKHFKYVDQNNVKGTRTTKVCQVLYRLLQDLDWGNMPKTSVTYHYKEKSVMSRAFLVSPTHSQFLNIRDFFNIIDDITSNFFNFFGIIVNEIDAGIVIAPQHGNNILAIYNPDGCPPLKEI